MTLTCARPDCGKTFALKGYWHQKFCSDQCRGKHSNEMYRKTFGISKSWFFRKKKRNKMSELLGKPTPGPVAPAYRYKAVLRRVIDGDTIVVDVDLGFHVWVRDVKLRLRDINAYELSEQKGVDALNFVLGIVGTNINYVVDCIKPDKYGDRWDAYVYLLDGRVLNQLVRDAGYDKNHPPAGV